MFTCGITAVLEAYPHGTQGSSGEVRDRGRGFMEEEGRDMDEALCDRDGQTHPQEAQSERGSCSESETQHWLVYLNGAWLPVTARFRLFICGLLTSFPSAKAHVALWLHNFASTNSLIIALACWSPDVKQINQ